MIDYYWLSYVGEDDIFQCAVLIEANSYTQAFSKALILGSSPESHCLAQHLPRITEKELERMTPYVNRLLSVEECKEFNHVMLAGMGPTN